MEKRLYVCVSPQTTEHDEATANHSLWVQPRCHEQADLSLQNLHAQVDSRPNDTLPAGRRVTPPNRCHTGAQHPPEVGCWAAPLLDKREFGRTIGFLGKSRTGMWGPRKEVQDQIGSGWLENLQVEREELEIHSETNETNSKV